MRFFLFCCRSLFPRNIVEAATSSVSLYYDLPLALAKIFPRWVLLSKLLSPDPASDKTKAIFCTLFYTELKKSPHYRPFSWAIGKTRNAGTPERRNAGTPERRNALHFLKKKVLKSGTHFIFLKNILTHYTMFLKLLKPGTHFMTFLKVTKTRNALHISSKII